jgi:hypothetical protein
MCSLLYTGPIPYSLGEIKKMEKLALDSNKITGDSPHFCGCGLAYLVFNSDFV